MTGRPKGDSGVDGLVAVLGIGNLSLAIPLQDLCSIESVLDIDTNDRSGDRLGSIDSPQGRCPVFCLTEAIELTVTPPGDRRICAIIAGADSVFGLMCSDVAALNADTLINAEVPACMRNAWSPFDGLAVQGDRVLCRTSGASLAQLLSVASTALAAPEGSSVAGDAVMHAELDPL
jgi:hypothetical protein